VPGVRVPSGRTLSSKVRSRQLRAAYRTRAESAFGVDSDLYIRGLRRASRSLTLRVAPTDGGIRRVLIASARIVRV
jgi:hypothetical protein